MHLLLTRESFFPPQFNSPPSRQGSLRSSPTPPPSAEGLQTLALLWAQPQKPSRSQAEARLSTVRQWGFMSLHLKHMFFGVKFPSVNLSCELSQDWDFWGKSYSAKMAEYITSFPNKPPLWIFMQSTFTLAFPGTKAYNNTAVQFNLYTNILTALN